MKKLGVSSRPSLAEPEGGGTGYPSSIDQYIEGFPEDVRKRLRDIRKTVKEAAPDATEKISYRMPTFFYHGNLVHFAAFAKHIGFYPTPTGITGFEAELAKYSGGKGSVRFHMDEPLPLDLIRRIAEFRYRENGGKRRSAESAT